MTYREQLATIRLASYIIGVQWAVQAQITAYDARKVTVNVDCFA